MTNPLAAYLATLERALRSLPAEERASIIAEIRSHIEDSMAASGKPIEDVLDSLGDPLELASAYLDQRKLEDAVVRSAHGTLLIAILEQAGRSLVAALLGFFALFFYLCMVAFAAMAVLKPIIPQLVGLWWGPHIFAFAILEKAPTGGQELLGYAIIPVAIVLGVGSFLAGRALTRVGGRLLLRKTQVLG
ncbi:DUF1700 domain-containing protein [Rhizomicrobium electricum]|nr:DUF1700 domain-containing protein [Rhizomicrobium electricum]NIJ47672.1 putative membrane protein [Rhizomicrobium electricum]